ncbi:hypothetical protein [Nocardia mangyaensis]|nr:hypothetical protein [Nocardia mangyaensis]
MTSDARPEIGTVREGFVRAARAPALRTAQLWCWVVAQLDGVR